jgi:HPt (histidine-containing phosphotransfer) domain-containing protein
MVVAAPLTDGLPLETRAQFIALQQRFVAGLPKRWQEIRDAADSQSLRLALHRLAGSAGSYGFAHMGQCAREAEALLMQEGDRAALKCLLAELETEIARVHAR